MSGSHCRRVLLLLLVALLCLSPLVRCQEPDMLTATDATDAADAAEADDAMLLMQMMPDDTLSLEEEEADGFLTAGVELEAEPVLSSSKKEAAPVVTKKAPPLRAVPYTYYRPVTTLQTITVPTQKVHMQQVVSKKQVPVTSKKGAGGYGGYAGNGLYNTPIGQMPGLGYGTTGGFGWSPLGALSGFGSFGKLGWGGYALGAPWLYGSFGGLAALAYGGGGHGGGGGY